MIGPHLAISAATNFLCSAGSTRLSRHDHGAQALLLLDEVRILQRGFECVVQFLQHVGGRSLGRVQAVPDRDLEVLETGFLHGRQILQCRRCQALARGDGISLDFLRLDLAARIGGLVAHQVDLAADQVGHGRSGALVGNRCHIHLERAHDQQAAQMRGRAQARVGQVDLALVGVEPGTQFGEIVRRQRGAADQRHRHVVDHADILEVIQRLERQVAIQRRRGGHADVVQQHRIAVSGGLGHLVGADRAARAGCVVDHDGAAPERLAHGFGQIPRDPVGRSAGGERHDDRDGLALGGEVGAVHAERSGQQDQWSQGLQQISHWKDSFGDFQIVGRSTRCRMAGTT